MPRIWGMGVVAIGCGGMGICSTCDLEGFLRKRFLELLACPVADCGTASSLQWTLCVWLIDIFAISAWNGDHASLWSSSATEVSRDSGSLWGVSFVHRCCVSFRCSGMRRYPHRELENSMERRSHDWRCCSPDGWNSALLGICSSVFRNRHSGKRSSLASFN